MVGRTAPIVGIARNPAGRVDRGRFGYKIFMYIGSGTLIFVLLVVLIVYLVRRA